VFLEAIDRVVPRAALVALVAPHDPKGATDRTPITAK
jgi:hypothetical protein